MRFDSVRPVVPGGWDIALPPLAPVLQRFPRVEVADVGAATADAVRQVALPDLAGKSIAITAGSRGIPGYVEILRALVTTLRGRGAEPFIVPAMGSHGGASAAGQLELLAGYGVTEANVGAPVRATMETRVVDSLPDGTPLHADRYAAEADGIVVFNKIKPHTAYKAPIESGLCKMLVIGLGKHEGARAMHRHDFSIFQKLIPTAAERIAARLPVLFALGVVENAWGEAAMIEAVTPDRLVARETELLTEAKRLMSRLLMPRIDVLIIDRIGKDISGAGLDPNVTGRSSTHAPGFDAPPIQKIIVRGLTPATHGNGAGIGNADFTTVRCVEELDFVATYTNVFSARVMQGAKLPVVLPNDRDALAGALLTCNDVGPETARVVRIPDTKHLDQVWVSQPVLDEIAGSVSFEQIGLLEPLLFGGDGYLVER